MDDTVTVPHDQASGDDLPAVGPFFTQVFHVDRPAASTRRIDLGRLERVDIGRGPADELHAVDASVVRLDLGDPAVSTQHARVERSEAGWRLVDLGSKNGSFVDGMPARRAPLADGATVEIGGAYFVFRGPRRLPPLAGAEAAAWGVLCGVAPPLMTHHPELAHTFAVLARMAKVAVPVLLYGETGTGKELVARALHGLSERKGRFVGVNCAALPASLVESELFGARRGAFSGADEDRIGFIRAADGGTLFLDEIAELAEGAQAALLRVLQEREVTPLGQTRAIPVDLRLVAATHADLAARVERGRFRADLFARIAGYVAPLLPLRARREDLGLVLSRLVRTGELDDGLALTRGAARLLLSHPFALNVRELVHLLRAAMTVAPNRKVDVPHLELASAAPGAPSPGTPSVPGRGPVPSGSPEEDKKARLAELLARHGGNVSAVARALETSRTQVQRLMTRYGLRREP